MNKIEAFLKKVEPFSTLPPNELKRLSFMVKADAYERGEVLYNEGEEATHVWLLVQGRAEILRYSSDQRPLALLSIGIGEIFGTLDRLGERSSYQTYPCTAVASVDSVAIRIPDILFRRFYERYPQVMISVCKLCSRRLSAMQDRALSYQEPVQTRVVKVLLSLQKSYGNTLPYTRREISSLAGTTVETTIRIMCDFQRKQWIHSERGVVMLKNVPQLQNSIHATAA